MHLSYILFFLLNFLLLKPTLAFYDTEIDRRLDNLFSDSKTKNLIIDYFDKMGAYRDWKQVTSIKLEGTIIYRNKPYSLKVYKKFPDKMKIVIQEFKQSYPKMTQIKNGLKDYCFIELPDKKIEEITPIFDLKEDMHIMPKLMHLLSQENEHLLLLEDPNSIHDTLEIKLLYSQTKNKYNFYINRNSKNISQYTIINNSNKINVLLEGTISDGRLRYPKKIKVETKAMEAELLYEKLNVNVGLTTSFFALPKGIE